MSWVVESKIDSCLHNETAANGFREKKLVNSEFQQGKNK